MEWLAVTVGYAVASALIPVVNAELYIVALMTQQPQLPWWAVGLAAAAGQMVGKVLYYFAGRGTLTLPARLHRRTERSGDGRWASRLDRFQETCQQRPVWTAGVLLVSASVGLPPYLAIAVLAGAGRVPLVTFLLTGMVGRFARFGAIAASPGLLDAWWF